MSLPGLPWWLQRSPSEWYARLIEGREYGAVFHIAYYGDGEIIWFAEGCGE